MSDCELLKSELIWVSNERFWGVASVFHVGGAEATKEVEMIDTRGTKGKGGWEIKFLGKNVLSAGLLINGIVDGSPPEMGVAGTICSWGPPMTPPSPWGALIRGALLCRFSAFMEGEPSGMTKEGGEGGFWEGELGLSMGRWVVPRCGESNPSAPKSRIGGEEGL